MRSRGRYLHAAIDIPRQTQEPTLLASFVIDGWLHGSGTSPHA